MTTNNAIKECRFPNQRPYFVTSDEEVVEYKFRPVVVHCSNCDKEGNGTPEFLESQGWFLRLSTVCSIECLFALADEKTEAFDLEGCPF